ncbi:uncharacterized protein AtWU_05836 [Aspergillus tubingensis]|uniref:uncharacterized protein n=1 Tax=Aspergillus tubingensis TaxID=5068 RepID=UPI0015782FA7|nr:uncharacterized protein AtWU_05836 [Aspergillus tubingensis]GFN16035.1 hypothetical protein AtWU_05836 [Aspergillus tubingensis]
MKSSFSLYHYYFLLLLRCPFAATGFGFYILSNHALSAVDIFLLTMERHGHHLFLFNSSIDHYFCLHTPLIRRHEPAQVYDLFHQK